MDWTLLIIGTLTAFWGVLSMHLIWREQHGNVEKSRQRRSLPSPKRFAQAGRLFAVLTY